MNNLPVNKQIIFILTLAAFVRQYAFDKTSCRSAKNHVKN